MICRQRAHTQIFAISVLFFGLSLGDLNANARTVKNSCESINPKSLVYSNCEFKKPYVASNYSGSHNLTFDGVTFDGMVSFQDLPQGEVGFTNCTFKSSVIFDHSNLNASFFGCTFSSGVSFTNCRSKQLVVAKCMSSNKTEGMIVNISGSFGGTESGFSCYFKDISDLEIRQNIPEEGPRGDGPLFGPSLTIMNIGNLRLKLDKLFSSSVKLNDINLCYLNIDESNFRSLRVEHVSLLSGSQLRHTQVGVMSLSDVVTVNVPESKSPTAAVESLGQENALKFVKDRKFESSFEGFVPFEIDGLGAKSTQEGLINIFKSAGASDSGRDNVVSYLEEKHYPKVSDQIFLDGQRIKDGRLLYWLQRLFTGFLKARLAWGPLLGIFVIIWGIGCVMFRKQNMKIRSGGHNAFWYSLESMLPGVELYAVKKAFPKNRRGLLYLRCHKLIGHIILGLFLGVSTGFIK